MNYAKTLEFLYRQLPMFQRTGPAAYKADLTTTIEICNRLNNPQCEFPVIHIAGTNGKGSISHFLASILQEEGYKTGLFTSPHLKDFRERIRINGIMIPEMQVVKFVEDHKDIFNDLRPSFFEYTFAMAMQYFFDQKIDILVAETGMGGRLDSTNITCPVLSVITNIGYDHTQFLGDTLEKIAGEKAGVIKENVPVVIGEKQNEIAQIFLDKALEYNTEINFAEDLLTINKSPSFKHDLLEVNLKDVVNGNTYDLKSPLKGIYQVKNLITSMAAVIQLNKDGFGISSKSIENGIQNTIINTGIRGRWEILSKQPLVICDTAHNGEGLSEVLDQIKNTTHQNLHIVLGVVADKNVDSLLTLFPQNATYYFCKADIPRGMPVNELNNKSIGFGLTGKNYSSVIEAYRAALETANPDDMVFIGGSTFVVGEIL